jgi:hypothetical protein
MKKFKDMGITPSRKGFVGDKREINQILNREIVVHEYKVEPSKYKEGSPCLHMQFEMNGSMHVLFLGSKSLIEMIDQVPKKDFPFLTTIIKENQKFVFS